MKKVFLLTQFGAPHRWTQEYLDHLGKLEPYGWSWKIFTPNALSTSSKNVDIIPMSLKEFDELVSKRCEVRPRNFIHNGAPHKRISDYYPAFGFLFEDYIKGFDFWGHTNWDVVYGRLDHFVSDQILEQSDIWSDDVRVINGVFCLYRNQSDINRLFMKVENWQEVFAEHRLFGFDEYMMTSLVRTLADNEQIRFNHPSYFALHSYDRLIQHQPKPNLMLMPDGALIERFEDPLMQAHSEVSLFKFGCFGREIMYFHFLTTKKWPL